MEPCISVCRISALSASAILPEAMEHTLIATRTCTHVVYSASATRDKELNFLMLATLATMYYLSGPAGGPDIEPKKIKDYTTNELYTADE